MIAAALRAALVGLIVAGLWVTSLVIRRPLASGALPGAAPVAGPTPGEGHLSPPSEQLLTRATGRPMFRADRRLALTPYDPERGSAPRPAAPPAEPRPVLTVTGLVLGAEPAALLDGAPGVEGSIVLRRGDTVGGLRMVKIEGDLVVIRGRDTTWRLRVREPWQ